MALKTDTDKIRRWREERRWSQEHLAELAGVGLRTLQRIETGGEASPDTLKALAAAFQVDVMALAVDPQAETARMLSARNRKAVDALRLSVLIHLAGYVIGMATFAAISIGLGAFVMKWAALWWTVGLTAHVATLVIVQTAMRFQEGQA